MKEKRTHAVRKLGEGVKVIPPDAEPRIVVRVLRYAIQGCLPHRRKLVKVPCEQRARKSAEGKREALI
jgi:hypothetical protein